MEELVKKLENRIDDLVQICQGLRKENETLRTDQQILRQEFKALEEKNLIARKRVETIVSRLKDNQG